MTVRLREYDGAGAPEPATETDALVSALVQNATNLPIAALQLREGELSPERQHELGSLLIQLGELMHQHADLGSKSAAVTQQRALWTPERGRTSHDQL
ncbi:hypothetical protein LWP59_33895 [Amycolatopsis acidiphila]|uniref:Uncharacterized protein n=1 Tax=Amycolatopsis acidiphila TaxID=715473 RepID=A0A558A8X3_9PSEU|nr:hypothetical protein [Amycolatopsis acidiphila]TVT20712.1 hypothetical protein FNH06_19550 [Amycolatopsis acidiphila]UIJ59014.1 hypothetical protein LWP59_33895 [Amycolatopsis acidiphila]GHG73347.1 hypothetical protein GCM10017788_36620 [Amycolatopsis acidiphila]